MALCVQVYLKMDRPDLAEKQVPAWCTGLQGAVLGCRGLNTGWHALPFVGMLLARPVVC